MHASWGHRRPTGLLAASRTRPNRSRGEKAKTEKERPLLACVSRVLVTNGPRHYGLAFDIVNFHKLTRAPEDPFDFREGLDFKPKACICIVVF